MKIPSLSRGLRFLVTLALWVPAFFAVKAVDPAPTSPVSNVTFASPFVYLRSPRGTMPHDHAPAPAAGAGVYASSGLISSRPAALETTAESKK